MTEQYFEYYDKEQAGSTTKYKFCPQCGLALNDVIIQARKRRACSGCGFIQYLNPLPGVCVVIEQNDRILIGQRAPGSVLEGKWCLPCGFIDHEESFLEAAHREVMEETNLEIRLVSLMNVSSNHISPKLHSIVPILTAEVVGGEAMAGDDIAALKWVSKTCELPEMAFISDPITIGKYFQGEFVGVPVDVRYQTMAHI